MVLRPIATGCRIVDAPRRSTDAHLMSWWIGVGCRLIGAECGTMISVLTVVEVASTMMVMGSQVTVVPQASRVTVLPRTARRTVLHAVRVLSQTMLGVVFAVLAARRRTGRRSAIKLSKHSSRRLIQAVARRCKLPLGPSAVRPVRSPTRVWPVRVRAELVLGPGSRWLV